MDKNGEISDASYVALKNDPNTSARIVLYAKTDPDEIRNNISKIKINETYRVSFNYNSNGLINEAYFRYYR